MIVSHVQAHVMASSSMNGALIPSNWGYLGFLFTTHAEVNIQQNASIYIHLIWAIQPHGLKHFKVAHKSQ